MRLKLSYTMMTGRFERRVDSEAELSAALRELAGTGAGNINVELTDPPSPDAPPPSPGRQIDPASHSISLVDARRPDAPIIYVNRGFEVLTGYTRDEVVGRNCRFLQGPDSDPQTVARIRTAVQRGESLIVDLLNYRKDGSTFWNRLSLPPCTTLKANSPTSSASSPTSRPCWRYRPWSRTGPGISPASARPAPPEPRAGPPRCRGRGLRALASPEGSEGRAARCRLGCASPGSVRPGAGCCPRPRARR